MEVEFKKVCPGEFPPEVGDEVINLSDIVYTPTGRRGEKYVVVSNPTPPDSGFVKHFFDPPQESTRPFTLQDVRNLKERFENG